MKTYICKCRKIIKIDDDDVPYFEAFNWSCNGQYLSREERTTTGRLYISLANELSGLLGLVDHKDRDSHNYQKESLRQCTPTQNNGNRGKYSTNTSSFQGVSLDDRKKHRKWLARICHEGKRKHIGYFYTAESAARAYDEEAKKLYGEFASLNFPTQQLSPDAELEANPI